MGSALALGFGLFQLRVMGAGDVKLIVAMALWIGLTIEVDAIHPLRMGLVGGVPGHAVRGRPAVRQSATFGEASHGVAIVLAGLYVRVGNFRCLPGGAPKPGSSAPQICPGASFSGSGYRKFLGPGAILRRFPGGRLQN